MELTISILAFIVSFATFLFTVLVTYRGEQREKKQATLDALNLLQEQVFDNLNTYIFGEIRDVAEQWSIAIEAKNKYVENKEGSAEDFWESHHEYDSAVDEYRKILGYLARIEHFALEVNTGIYDASYFSVKGYDRKILSKWTKNCVGTVHTFQGKDANEVLLVLGCSNKSVGAMNWVVKKANILNVACTRAKYRIAFIGNINDWKNRRYFREFIPNLIDIINV